jgi:hypothetical protein
LYSLDAPLIAPGKANLLDYDQAQPDLKKGMHVNLFNNLWGTNFPMWSDEDGQFRFILNWHKQP